MSTDVKTVLSEVRVRTSEGEAFFFTPPNGSKKSVQLGNGIPNKWLKIPAGTEFQLCAKFNKTDTFMVALLTVGNAPIGIVLRRMSYAKLLESTNAVVVTAEPATSEIVPEQIGAIVDGEQELAQDSEAEGTKEEVAA